MTRRRLFAATGTAVALGTAASRHPTRAAEPRRVLLINPNTNTTTTAMMVKIAQSAAPAGIEVLGATAARGPLMLVDPDALAAAAPQVVAIGVAQATAVSGIIVSAFGDPGFADLRRQVGIPVVGIAQAAMLAASANGRRFGIATTTPRLVAAIDARAAELGLAGSYTGTRITTEDPNTLTADPDRLVAALRKIVADCIDIDKAEAVIIGGGPLGNAATALTPLFTVPVIAPIPAAIQRLAAQLT